MSRTKVAVILESSAGELGRELIEIDEQNDGLQISDQIHEAIGNFVLSIDDTVRVVRL